MHSQVYITSLLSVLILGCLCYFLYQKTHAVEVSTADLTNLPPAVRYGSKDVSVILKCSNIRLAYFLLGTMFWSVAVLFICMAFTNAADPDTSSFAKLLISILTKPIVLEVYGISFIAAFFYFFYSRINITWDNGVVIGEKQFNILYFDIKKYAMGINIIYLQSANNLWILGPTTSQDNYKFKNAAIVKREMAFNQNQIAQLQTNLSTTGANQKIFRLFTPYIVSGFIAFIITMVCCVVIF